MPANRNDCALADNPRCFWNQMKPEWEELDGLCTNPRISITDIDAMLEVRGHFLWIEWKVDTYRRPPPQGQEIMLKNLTRALDGKALYIVGKPRPMQPMFCIEFRSGEKSIWRDIDLDWLKDYIRAFDKEAIAHPRNR